MKYLSGCVLIFCAFIQVLAQQKPFFLEYSHDFGAVKEEGGSISYEFKIFNADKEPVVIEHVEASCGCTTPGWSAEAILPGDTGFVKAQYDPMNRPGKFEKTLTVSLKLGSNKSLTETLNIEGDVLPKPTTIKEELHTDMGALKVKFKSLNMGKITNNEVAVMDFDVWNTSENVINWKPNISGLPKHIQVEFMPVSLGANELGKIRIKYDPIKKDDYGFVSDKIELFTDEYNDFMKEFNVIASIFEYFPEMTPEQLSKAPRLAFDRSQHDFGSVKAGVDLVTTFQVVNNGASELKIRKIKPNCGCTVAKLQRMNIPAGQSETVEVKFNTSGRKGREYKTITFFTNDPSASAQVLTIKADVN